MLRLLLLLLLLLWLLLLLLVEVVLLAICDDYLRYPSTYSVSRIDNGTDACTTTTTTSAVRHCLLSEMGVDRVDQVRCVAVGKDVPRCRRGRDRVVDVGIGGRPRGVNLSTGPQ